MQYGLYFGAMPTGWYHADPSTPFPGEFQYVSGARIIDLSTIHADVVVQIMSKWLALPPDQLDLLSSSYPQIILPPVPPATPGWETICQPGLRRIAYRPSQQWHNQELAARLNANARLVRGEDHHRAIAAAFHYLSDQDQQARIEMSNGSLFPLTPMVRLVEHTTTLSDEREGTKMIRQFPFHEPVAVF